MADKKIREKRLTARRVFLDPSTPSNWTVVRVVLLTFIVWYFASFFATLLSTLSYLFFLIVLSIFFAYLIDPLVKLIRRPFKERNLSKLMPRPLAIVIAYILVFAVLGIGIASLAPIVSAQAKELTKNIPDYLNSGQTRLNDLNQRFQIPEETQKQINDKITGSIGEVGTYLTAFLLIVVSYAPWLILIPVLSFFFLKDINIFRVIFLRIFPSGRWRARADLVLNDVDNTLRAYARAQLFSCVIIGLICTVGFYLLGINYALLLGILAGVFEFVPLIGPLTIGAIAILVASFSNTPLTGLYTAVFLVVLRILQDYVFYPRIVREGIHLHPLAIILSVLAGEQIAGIPGVFISIPIVALGTVIYKHFLEHSGTTGVFAGWLEPQEIPAEEI